MRTSKAAVAHTGPRRRGAIAVLAAVLLVVVLAMIAFAVDIGYIANVRTELQMAADAAALAGAGALKDGTEEADAVARRYVRLNGGVSARSENPHVDVELGEWNGESRTFLPSPAGGTAVRVTVRRTGAPLFFARILGKRHVDNLATSVAAAGSVRDTMVLLDASQTMNDDSELKSIDRLGRAAIEDNLLQIYRELDSPQFGNLTWTPRFATVVGKPPRSRSQPQITVRFQGDSVYITSTKDLSNVVLGFPRGAHQKFDGLSGHTGTFSGTGANANKSIEKVWVKSGSNKSGDGPGYGERFQDHPGTIKKALGLHKVRYPYHSGSWDDYIEYVKTSPVLREAGYQKKYGYLTWVNYLLEKQPAAHQTADLWKTSSQPMAAAKHAVRHSLEQLQSGSDRVGLTVFNSPGWGGRVESQLTADHSRVEHLASRIQAAHYARPANLGSGLETATQQLQASERSSAAKTIVLVSDGRTTLPNNTSAARRFALEQAQAAGAAGIRIVTISVGARADIDLMQQIAELSAGTHLHASSGQPGGIEQQLEEAFRELTGEDGVRLVD